MRQRDKAILTGQRQIVFINTREKKGADPFRIRGPDVREEMNEKLLLIRAYTGFVIYV